MKLSDPPKTQRWALYSSPLGSYMKRWIFRFAGRTLRVHNILESDAGRDFHDHPFSFVSLILAGGYIEHVPGCDCQVWRPANFPNVRAMSYVPGNPCRYFGPGSIVRRSATDLHRLELVNGSAWTLVLTSQYKRGWGFQTPSGWVPYKSYERSFYQEKP